jgi:hypothetical protein
MRVTPAARRPPKFAGGFPVPRPRGSIPAPHRPQVRRFLSIRWGLRASGGVAVGVVAGVAPRWLPLVGTLLLLVIGSALIARGIGRAIGNAAAADAMLVDLRNRVLVRSTMPPLPVGWWLDTDLRSAHGESFSGDFVITAAPAPNRLEVVLVDVSGKGQVAGGRALLLASAVEALLDAVPSEQFLPAANQYVLRHGDDDGFATAVWVSLDLETGEFVLSGAGHPPAAHYRAGSGRWLVLDDDQGPALGLMAEAGFPTRAGRLGHGDALLLFTDGLVENRRLDVGRGIDRLIGHADALLARGVDGPAARIAEANRAEKGDDRALVVIRRR